MKILWGERSVEFKLHNIYFYDFQAMRPHPREPGLKETKVFNRADLPLLMEVVLWCQEQFGGPVSSLGAAGGWTYNLNETSFNRLEVLSRTTTQYKSQPNPTYELNICLDPKLAPIFKLRWC